MPVITGAWLGGTELKKGYLGSQLLFDNSVVGVTQPTVVRVAEIGTRDAGGTADWVDSGTFDASGTETNRCLLIVACCFSNTSGSTWINNGVTVGGTAATLEADLIASPINRNTSAAIWSRVAPANDAALAVAWNISMNNGNFDASKVYGVLLQDVDQTDPVGATAAQNEGETSPILVQITTLHDTSLLIGGFTTRGGDANVHPLGAHDGSTVEINTATGEDNTDSTSAAVASKAAATAGAHSLGVTMPSGDRCGGTVVEVRGA